MTSRREVIIALGALALMAPRTALCQGQATRIPIIGYLEPAAPQNNSSRFLDDFRQGLRELGYVENKTIQLEVRWGEGVLDRMPALAAELVRLKVDVIVAVTSPSVFAAREATRTIPIVMPLSSDPVGDGLVASLARPGGNITGLSVMAPELGAKRLQLLKDVFPSLTRPLAVVWNPDYSGMKARFREAQSAAPAVGVGVESVEVRDPADLDRAFARLGHEPTDGLVVLVDPLTVSQRFRIVEFAARERLPAIYETSIFVEAGGLMSYGPSPDEMLRRAASYVDRILKGAKPSNLPIEQPSKFDLVINLKTAKSLGITIPQAVLVQADRVIE
jgi:putative tryptophan/tyrosine transport system substrate-binding protein